MANQEVVAVIPDNVLIQEMLKRQMESLKYRSANNLESQRIQEVIQRQLDQTNYRQQLIEGENQRYYRIFRPLRETTPDLTNEEIFRIHKTIQNQITSLGCSQIPELNEKDTEKSLQQYYQVIIELCSNIKELKETKKDELNEQESNLYELQNSQKDEIQELEKSNLQLQQELQMLKTEISNTELKMKEENKQFQLKMRPKRLALEKIERRSKLAKNEKLNTAKKQV